MRRAALAAPVAGVLAGGFGGTAALVPAAQSCAAATYSSHVTLVVEHGNAAVVGLCIGFSGSSITGEQILQASGLEYATQSYGSLGDAVCQLDNEPASYSACLPANGSYWAMFVSRGGGGWQNADRGVSSETFGDGDAEGFRYDAQSGSEPPPPSPAGICARALATPTAAAVVPPSVAAAPPAQGVSAAAGPTASGDSTPEAAAPPSTPPSPQASVIRPAGSAGGVATARSRAARSPTAPSAALLGAAAAIAALAGLAIARLLWRRRAGPS